MADDKLCPLKAGAVQAQFGYLMAIGDDEGQLYIYEDAQEEAQEEFGMCDREKCALWATYLDLNSKERGYCGLIHNP